jgi:LmbE family N-acetylglucosaminyl deacetylase
MLKVHFDQPNGTDYSLLCLGAHCDDIEIGCGGTVLKLIDRYPNLRVDWVVFSANELRRKEAEKSADLFLKDAQQKRVVIHEFRDGFLPYHGIEVKERFEQLKQEVKPDLILTHYRHDLHQDHRLVCDLTWNTFRNHLILEYEIPKYDGDLGVPNFFVTLDEDLCRRKVAYLWEGFESQRDKQWFTDETFRSLLRIRGIEANSPTKYAEAFYGRKIVL